MESSHLTLYSLGLATVQTGGILFTNCLFMLIKIIDVFKAVHAPEGVFISAYLKEKLQYNDLDNSDV